MQQQHGMEGSRSSRDSVRLTADELTDLMNEAIARHGAEERSRQDRRELASMEDALEIARQLSIPEEHVLAAADQLRVRKLRGMRREIVRSRRQSAFLLGLAWALVGLVLMALTRGGWLGVSIFLPGIIALAVTAWRWLLAPISDSEADSVELLPVPGKCRVCWADAVNSRATFCQEHQYKGPGAVGGGH